MIFSTRLSKRLLIFSAGLLLTLNVFAQSQQHRTENWISNTGIGRLEHSNGYTLLSGSFTQVGPYTGSAVITDPVTGEVDDAMPKVNGSVYSVAPDGSGGWYIGGYFTGVDTVKVSNLVHIKADKTVDRNWKPNPISSPLALTVSGTTLYVGGYFTTIAGQGRNYIAAFDISSGNLSPWNPDADGWVQAIAIDPATGNVYAGGNFSNIGGSARTGLAALSATTGQATTWNPVITNTFTPNVQAIAIDASTIFIGGSFTSAGGQPRSSVARLSLTTGLATAWTANTSAGGYIDDIVLSGTTLFIAGSFSTINGIARVNLAAVPTLTTGVLPWNVTFGASFSFVYDLSISGSTLYIAGYFDTVNALPRSHVAAVDIATATLQSWAPSPISGTYVVHPTPTGIFIGGDMNGVNWVARNEGFAIFDDATDQAWPFQVDLNGGVVNTIAVKDNVLYIGGQFIAVNKTPRNNLAAIDLATGQLLPWDPQVFGLSAIDRTASVYTMKIDGNTLYIGGKFFAVNGMTTIRPGLAAIDLASGIATNWNPQVGDLKTMDQFVNSIDISLGTVYVGGLFSLLSGNQPRSNLAAIGTNGTVLPWAPISNGMIDKIRVSGTIAYVVGEFANGIGGKIRTSRVAALDVNSNNATSWDPVFQNGAVNDIAMSGPDLYVAGWYESIGNQPRPGLSAFNAATGGLKSWVPDAGSNSDGQYNINSITASDTKVYITGSFDFLGIEHRTNFGEYTTCPDKPVIALDGMQLSTNSPGTLQWYFNNFLLDGATSPTLDFYFMEYGVYAVTTTVDECTIRSDDFYYYITETEMSNGKELTVYPNPVREELSVELPAPSGSVELKVIDMMGRMIKTVQSSGIEHKISTRELEAGSYILLIQNQRQKHVRKIIKVN